MAETNKQFATKIGLIAATVGSAIGLGNVWRFPAETQANGGAAFLILYIGCVLLLGVPVMLGEFSLGRAGRSDSVGVFRKLSSGGRWWIFGAVAILASYLIAMFYMVVAGWTLEYLCCSASGSLFASEVGNTRAHYLGVMDSLLYGSWQPIVGTVAIIIINIFILLRGVQKGIERLSNVLMPLLFLILLALCVVSLSLSGAQEGLAFFLRPDFSKINAAVVINALGQTFFSLSLGMGILITYASYYPPTTNLPRTSMTVALLSVLVALLMGFIIFPAVKTFGLEGEGLSGTTLIFITLPEVFGNLPLPQLWSSLFFLLLLVAAVTSTVSISEVSIAFLIDRCGLKRRSAVFVSLCPLLVFSPLCAMSIGPSEWLHFGGVPLFDVLDNFATNILLPIVAIGTSVFIGWFAPRKLLVSELTNGSFRRTFFVKFTIFILRFVAPVAIAAILVAHWV